MDAVLPLLPARGLDQSILLPVLVGMLVMLALTETLGWGFVGVVVPGYLASVLAIEPLTGIAIFTEALVTLALARGAATVLSRAEGWTEFFGRDRFFLIVFISVVVRQHDHTWLYPALASAFDGRFGTQVLLEQRFFSVGLVIVPLMANMFWKPDRLEGLIKISTIVLITWGVLELILLPYTNLSFGSFELTYENAALDFLGNAKAYIILLTTAYLGAAFNLRYGWDYNGILIPALLALLWLTPLKLLATCFEAVVLLYCVKAALRMPGLRTANLEGPRKIAFVFTLAFILKWLAGFALGDRFPGLRLTDLFAFGYLLSSLLAVRMLQRKTVRGVMLPALLTASVGFAAGSVVGFGLEFLAPERNEELAPERAETQSTRLLEHPEGVLALGRLRAADADRGFAELSPSVRAGYARAWRAIAQWVERPSAERRADAYAAAARTGLAVRAFPLEREGSRKDNRPVHVIVESENSGTRFGFELALARPGAKGPVLLHPHPSIESHAADAAWTLCLEVDCPLIVLSGADPRDTELAALPETLGVVSSQLASLSRIEVRGDPGVPRGQPRLHVHGNTPPGIGGLNQLFPGLVLDWAAPPEREDWSDARWSILRVNPLDYVAELDEQARAAEKLVNSDESLEAFVGRIRSEGRDAPSSPVDAPSRDDLRFIERLLVAPLVDAAELRRRGMAAGSAPAQSPAELSERIDTIVMRIAQRADLIGFDLISMPDCMAGDACWVLADRRRPSARSWGTMVVRPAGNPELAVEIPRPQRATGTRRLGLDLWAASDAGALILAGADGPGAGFDADPSLRGNHLTPFQAMHQGLEAASRSPSLVLQARGIAAWRPLAAQVVVGMGRPVEGRDKLPSSIPALFEDGGPLDWIDSWIVADGSPDLYSLAGAGVPQLEYSSALDGAAVVTLWFAEDLRKKFRQGSPRLIEESLARLKLDFRPLDEEALGLPPGWRARAVDLQSGPSGAQQSASALEPHRQIFEEGVAIAEAYARSRNIHRLRDLQDWAAQVESTKPRRGEAAPALRFVAGTGQASGQPVLYLSADGEGQRYVAFVKLSKDLAPEDERRTWLPEGADATLLRAAIFERARTVQVSLIPENAGVAEPLPGGAP